MKRTGTFRVWLTQGALALGTVAVVALAATAANAAGCCQCPLPSCGPPTAEGSCGDNCALVPDGTCDGSTGRCTSSQSAVDGRGENGGGEASGQLALAGAAL